MDLLHKQCAPCEGGVDPLSPEEIKKYHDLLEEGWKVIDNKRIEKIYKFEDFRQALAFTNLVGEIAEIEGHHPDIELTYGKVKVTLWTHAINGLSINDFIVAAKADESLSRQFQACY